MKLLPTCLALAAMTAMPLAAAVAAETATLPSMYSTASLSTAGAPAGKLRNGSRVGTRVGKESGLDDSAATTIIVAVAAGTFGYFAHDIFDNHHDHDNSPN